MPTHLDCRNFAPVDVAKGVCHVKKKVILADGESCETFDRLPKCKHCQQYAPGAAEYLGVCQATKNRPMTYPDLAGVTCDWFVWKTSLEASA
jgi:4-hydroxyphenylacetate decarboxylase small subunit